MTADFERVDIGNATLFCGDALAVLPELRAMGLVPDLCLSDVPYRLTSGGPSAVLGGMLSSTAGYNNDGQIIPCDIEFSDFMPPVFDALADDADAYFMADARNVIDVQYAALDAGFEHHNMLVWKKDNATPNRWYMKNCEFTYYCFKGRARVLNDCGMGQILSFPNPRNKHHPTEKPVPLMQVYISNSTDPGDLVIDPFMGAGSTGVAAIQSGRRFVGIELHRPFFDIAKERIRAAVPRPVSVPGAKPVQESLFSAAG